jgi:hypothetical protein
MNRMVFAAVLLVVALTTLAGPALAGDEVELRVVESVGTVPPAANLTFPPASLPAPDSLLPDRGVR